MHNGLSTQAEGLLTKVQATGAPGDDLEVDWQVNYPYWSIPDIGARRQLGDCYAMVADAILTTEQPYPGDELFNSENLWPELRFNITLGLTTGEYTIYDRLVEGRTYMARELLEKP